MLRRSFAFDQLIALSYPPVFLNEEDQSRRVFRHNAQDFVLSDTVTTVLYFTMCQICFLESEAYFQQPLELYMYLWSMGQSAHSGAEGTVGEVKSLEQVPFLSERVFRKGRTLARDF